MGGDGIISGALVEGNIIYDNGVGGGSGINADGVQNSRFQNNLIYSNHASGISLYRIDGGGGSIEQRRRQQHDRRRQPTAAGPSTFSQGSTGNTVRNNILYSSHSFRGSIDISADSLSGFTSDYNVVMNRFTTNGGDSVQTLAQWQAATGQDLHSLVATPAQLFVNPAARRLSICWPAARPSTRARRRSRRRLTWKATLARRARRFDIGAYRARLARLTASAPPTNNRPTDISLSQQRSRRTAPRERSSAHSPTVDPDAGDSHAFTLLANAGGRFAISGNQLVVAAGAVLDWETAASHSVTVRTTDGGGLTYDETFTITVSNVNEIVSFDVQRGASQRSYIRYVDLVFESADGLAQLISQGRLSLTRYSLTGTAARTSAWPIAPRLSAIASRSISARRASAATAIRLRATAIID